MTNTTCIPKSEFRNDDIDDDNFSYEDSDYQYPSSSDSEAEDHGEDNAYYDDGVDRVTERRMLDVDSGIVADSAQQAFGCSGKKDEDSAPLVCLQCTYFNQINDSICQGCDIALVANPCPHVDELMANQILQKDHDSMFFQEIGNDRRLSEMIMEEETFDPIDDLPISIPRLARDDDTSVKCNHDNPIPTLPSICFDVSQPQIIIMDGSTTNTYDSGGHCISANTENVENRGFLYRLVLFVCCNFFCRYSDNSASDPHRTS